MKVKDRLCYGRWWPKDRLWIWARWWPRCMCWTTPLLVAGSSTCRNPRRPAPARHQQPGPEPALLVWDRWAIFLHILIFTTAAADCCSDSRLGTGETLTLSRAVLPPAAQPEPEQQVSPHHHTVPHHHVWKSRSSLNHNLQRADANDVTTPAAVVTMQQ